jgi:hypothetical protein
MKVRISARCVFGYQQNELPIYYLPEDRSMGIERVLDGRRDVARIIERALAN